MNEAQSTVVDECRRLLSATWREADGFCPPNPSVYPHQWLWDSCFHSIAWASISDNRAVRELMSCLSGQLDSGFVPHMRYFEATTSRGPLDDRSSYTQPPIYAHALRCLSDRNFAISGDAISAVERGLDWLWQHRRTDDGLIFIVHPWESGTDDSPRWDSWVGADRYDKAAYRAHDARLVEQSLFDDDGAAVWSQTFVVAPASFNAFTAHAARELATLTGSSTWDARSRELADAMDRHLWDDVQGLWIDRGIVGGGASVRLPTLDGVFGALVTPDATKAGRALDQLQDASRFAAPYGLAYVWRSHEAYDPTQYWRGPAWPQLNYLAGLAADRWQRSDLRAELARCSVAAARRSEYAEYWNPETGGGLGSKPQGWAALAATWVQLFVRGR